MKNKGKTPDRSDSIRKRTWLRRTARSARRLTSLTKIFVGIYAPFVVTVIASYWLPLNPLATCLGIVVFLFIFWMLPSMFLWMWCLRSMTNMLTTIGAEESVANIGAVASLGRALLPRSNRSQVAAIMDQSLALLTAPLLLDMSVEDRRNIYEFMIYSKPTTCQTILSLCEQAQDILALPFLRRLIRRYRDGRDADVLAQAFHCLEILNPKEMANPNHLLLRASTQPTGAELLRPIVDHASASEELLRAITGAVDVQGERQEQRQ